MKNKFAARLSSLRKKSGMSQSAAAKKLGISQALLSHYEKGIRECGLDFVLAAAKVFDVSCDYLLGATDLLPESDHEEVYETLQKKPKLFLARNRLQNAIDLLYSIMARFGNPKMHQDINNLFYADTYLAMRIFQHSVNDQESDLFAEPYEPALLHALSLQSSAAEKLMMRSSEWDKTDTLDRKRLFSEYSANFASVMGIIESVEGVKP